MRQIWDRREIICWAGLSCLARGESLSYRAQVEKWRKEKEEALKADDGWLTVAGLHWLEEGVPRSEIATGLTFELRDGKVTVRAAAGAGARINGNPLGEAGLRPDVPGPADLVTLGRLTLFVIARGDRFGIRVRDLDSRFRRQFRGLSWYPVNEAYRVEARFLPHPEPKTVSIPTIIDGLSEQMISPGIVEFPLGGKLCRLEPVVSGKQLFLIFKDQTSSKSTYPAGRFLYSDLPRNGRVLLDFNKAYNPPCAFTPYATCPLPPRQNHLGCAIEAGELDYHYE